MNLGYLHRDYQKLNNAETIQSYEIVKSLSQSHSLYGTKYSQFKEINKLYLNKKDLFKFFNKIDLLFTIVDGYVDLYNEKFTPIAKLFKIPNVWLLNAPIEEMLCFPHNKTSFLFYKKFRNWTSSFVDHAICVSKEMANYASFKLGIKNVSVVSNGVNPQLFSPETKVNPLFNQKKFTVVWAGNGSFSWQALDVILKVAQNIEKKDPNIYFLIISDKTWIERKKLSNVVYLHSVENSDLPQYLNLADILLCLYNRQPGIDFFYRSPMKLFEYMSMQKPIIASKRGQIEEIIKHKKNGLLTNNSIHELTQQILELKQNKQLSQQISKQARFEVLRSHTWNLKTKQIKKILEQNLA